MEKIMDIFGKKRIKELEELVELLRIENRVFLELYADTRQRLVDLKSNPSQLLYNYTLILPGSVKIEIVADSHNKVAIGSWDFYKDDKVCSSYDNILGFSRSPVEK